MSQPYELFFSFAESSNLSLVRVHMDDISADKDLEPNDQSPKTLKLLSKPKSVSIFCMEIIDHTLKTSLKYKFYLKENKDYGNEK